MWFVVVLLFAVVAAQPSDRDHLDQVGSLSRERYFPDPRPGSETPIRPRWQHKKVGSSAFKPEQMNPWNPDEASEQQAQAASDGSPDLTFPDQNGKGKRGEEFDQGTWRSRQWDKQGVSGKSQRSGRSGRPPFKPVRLPVHPPHDPADGGRENQMDQFLGKPLSQNMMDNRQFLPIFKAENVTWQNVSTYHLKEGENIFLLPKGKEQKQPPKGGVKRPQEMGYDYFPTGPQPYVKLIYNPRATQKISFEYGMTMLLPSFMKAESESD